MTAVPQYLSVKPSQPPGPEQVSALAGRLFDARVGDLLHAAVADHADEALVQHRIAGDRSACRGAARGRRAGRVAGAAPLFSTESAIVNMYLSSTDDRRA